MVESHVLQLPARLLAVAGQVPAGQPVADIGTDHGLLPMFLLVTGQVPVAYALDLRPGPLSRARATAASLGLGESQGLRIQLSDGLAQLAPGEARTATLAGLGGGLVVRILRAAPGHLSGAPGLRRIVASPNLEPERVRAWCVEAGWAVVHEEIVEDRGRYYPVLSLEPRASGAPAPDWTEADLRFGPLLRRSRPAPWLRWLASERARLESALGRASEGARSADLSALRAELALVSAELEG